MIFSFPLSISLPFTARNTDSYPYSVSTPEIPFIPNLCFYSAFSFLVNAWICYLLSYFLYSFLFVSLWTTSVIYHSIPDNFINKIDKIFVYSVILYGAYVFFYKLLYIKTWIEYTISFFILLSFIAVIYLYCYGSFVNAYCFHKNKKVGQMYHAILHLISSIGHALIIIL
jgi:hypothetical protein